MSAVGGVRAPQAEDKTAINAVYSSRGRANNYVFFRSPSLVPLFQYDNKTETNKYPNLAGGSGGRLAGGSKSAGPLRAAGGVAPPPPGRGSGGASSKLLTSLSAAEIKLQSSRSSSSLTSKVR